MTIYYLMARVPCPTCEGRSAEAKRLWQDFLRTFPDAGVSRDPLVWTEAHFDWWLSYRYEAGEIPAYLATCLDCSGSGEVETQMPMANVLPRLLKDLGLPTRDTWEAIQTLLMQLCDRANALEARMANLPAAAELLAMAQDILRIDREDEARRQRLAAYEQPAPLTDEALKDVGSIESEPEPETVICPACSHAGGAERPIYHAPPICQKPEPVSDPPAGCGDALLFDVFPGEVEHE